MRDMALTPDLLFFAGCLRSTQESKPLGRFTIWRKRDARPLPGAAASLAYAPRRTCPKKVDARIEAVHDDGGFP
jgi:hypothetical protein